LVFDEHGFGDHGPRAARTGESGDCHQQMQEQDDQIAHGTIMPPREIQEMLRIWQFAMHRGHGAKCVILFRKIGSSGWIRTSNPPVHRSAPDDRPSDTQRDEGDENQ
jgi:hypothetical protein